MIHNYKYTFRITMSESFVRPTELSCSAQYKTLDIYSIHSIHYISYSIRTYESY